MKFYKVFSSVLLATILFLSPLNIVKAEFTDLGTHWAKNDILSLSQRGIIKGYPGDIIKPEDEITRAEITALLVNAAGHPVGGTDLEFIDNDKIPNWAKGYVQSCVDKGIIRGYEDNSFRPYRKVRRSELVIMIMWAFAFDVPKSGDTNYADNSQIPAWAKIFVAKASQLGVIKGYTDNTFRPDKNITRAEAFTVVLKAIELRTKRK